MPRPLLVVDAPYMLFRAFYALPRSITDEKGRPVNALLGAANAILSEVDRRRPRAVVLCFGPDAAAYRLELFPAYHAARDEVPAELAPQFEDSEAFFGAFGWTIASDEALEADDLLHSFALREVDAGGRALLLTGDRDMFQCATKDVRVLYAGRGGVEEMGPREVRERYGIPPRLVPDFIALRGDPSDGIPGAKGVGEKTAAELLRRHGSLQGVLAAAFREPRAGLRKALTEAPEELLAYKQVATLQVSRVKRPRDKRTDRASAARAARRRGMRRLAERLEAGRSR